MPSGAARAVMMQQRGNLAPAPVLQNADMQDFSGLATSFNYDPSQLTIGGNRVFTLSGSSNSPTISTFAGDTDDTSSGLLQAESVVKVYGREWTVASTLDANWVLTMPGSVRCGILGLVVSGIGSIPTPVTATGTGPTLPNHASFPLTGGPRNALVVDFMTVQGSHVDEFPVAPSGHTLIDTIAYTGTENPGGTSYVTVAAAQRTYSQVSSIPAATWGGLADVAASNNPWVVARTVFLG